MRIGFRHWLIAGLLAVALNVAAILLVSMQENVAGAATIRPGPQIEMSDSLAGIMGEPLEISEIQPEKIDEIEPQPEVVETSKPVELAATAPVVLPDNMQSLEALPVAPTMELKTTEPAPVLTPVTPEKVEVKEEEKKAEPPEKTKKVETKPEKTRKTKTKKATKTGKRTTKERGNAKNGQAGKSKTGGASAAAVAGFGSQVRGRIASAARRAAKGKGSVRVTVSISPSGSASVSVSGPSALANAVRSAVSGTSFPRPPQGAPRSYTVSITFR